MSPGVSEAGSKRSLTPSHDHATAKAPLAKTCRVDEGDTNSELQKVCDQRAFMYPYAGYLCSSVLESSCCGSALLV